MAAYADASRTKDFFEAELFARHPRIVSIAPQEALDEEGHATGVGVIVIGVRDEDARRSGGSASSGPKDSGIPSELPLITADNVRHPSEYVKVEVVVTGEILLEGYTTGVRPCPGGYGLGHFLITAGTLGGVVRERGGRDWAYILSNNHVLAAENIGRPGDPIYQPGVINGGSSKDRIGALERFVPVDDRGGCNEVDCAIARVDAPWAQRVTREVVGIGVPGAVADAANLQYVRKVGKKTGLTTGRIKSTNANYTIPFGNGSAKFVNQLQYTSMTLGGDSGSLIWDASSLVVVGLHAAGDRVFSFGNKILRVLDLLQVDLTDY